MSEPVAVGQTFPARYTVTDEMSPPHLPTKVLSTPDMIRLIEQTCLVGVQPHLDDDSTTVGIHVCVSHESAVASGDEVTVSCSITEIDRRRLVFAVSVTTGDDTVVSQGTHQRFIVSTADRQEA